MINSHIEHRRLYLADRLPAFNELVNLLKHRFIDPNFTTSAAYLGRHVLEKVKPITATFLMRYRCRFDLPSTDRARIV